MQIGGNEKFQEFRNNQLLKRLLNAINPSYYLKIKFMRAKILFETQYASSMNNVILKDIAGLSHTEVGMFVRVFVCVGL